MARGNCILDTNSRQFTACGFLGIAGLLAFCSLSYELLLAKIVSEITGQATLWESVTMGSFLLGLGMRSLVFKSGSDFSLVKQLLKTERHMIVWSMTSWIWVFVAAILYRIYLYDDGLLRELWPFPPVMLLGALAQLGPLALGWFSGYELQFFLYFREGLFLKRQTAKVLAVYHLGGLVATFAFLVGLSQAWSPSLMLTGVIGLSFFVLIVLMGLSKRFVPDFQIAGLMTPCLRILAAFVVFCLVQKPLESLEQKNFYFNQLLWRYTQAEIKDIHHPLGLLDLIGKAPTWPDVKRLRTPYQVIDIIYHNATPHLADPHHGTMHINGRFQIDSTTAATYHETMVHVPLGMASGPIRKVLVLGGGDGAIVRELRKYEKSLDQVVLVDIDPVVIELARNEPFLVEINDGAFSWGRLETHVGDALEFLRQDLRNYDAVFLDLTYPYEFDSSRFYTHEFFRLMHKRLGPDGFFVLGSPVDLLTGRDTKFTEMLRSTATAAGFPFQWGISGRRDHFLVAGKTNSSSVCEIPAEISLRALQREPSRDWEVRSLTGKLSLESINSVMRPHTLGTSDSFY